MIKIKSYQVGPDSPRNPLGGREADGFGDWVTTTYLQMRDTAAQFTRPEDESVPAQMMRESQLHYGRVRQRWVAITAPDAWEFARDSFEVMLITDVMSAHALATYAREQVAAGRSPRPGERPWALMCAEYVRATLILATYLGIDQAAVGKCGDDQDKLSALRG